MKKLSKFKKLIIITLSIICIIAIACIARPFIKPIAVEGRLIPYNYTIYGTYVSLEDYTGGSHDVKIPSYIWFRPVKEIRFTDEYYLESVILPDTMEDLKVYFSGCINLQNVELGEKVKIMDNAYFARCWDLKEIRIPGNVERMSGETFSGCTSLENVIICNPNMKMEGEIFWNCDLDKLTLKSEKNSDVEAYAKEYGIKFEEVDVSLIQEPEKNVGEGGREGDYTYKVLEDGTACLLKYWGEETMVTLPSEIAGRKVSATFATFKDNWDVREVVIPDSIVHIGDSTFENTGLQAVYGGEHVECIDWHGFYDCTGLVEVPEFPNLREIGISAFLSCNDIEQFKFGKHLKKIGVKAFWMCGMKKVELPQGLEVIEDRAFQSCYEMDELEIPASVTYIGEGAFPYHVEEDGTIIGSDFHLIVEEGSYAETYAIENEIPYEVK